MNNFRMFNTLGNLELECVSVCVCYFKQIIFCPSLLLLRTHTQKLKKSPKQELEIWLSD